MSPTVADDLRCVASGTLARPARRRAWLVRSGRQGGNGVDDVYLLGLAASPRDVRVDECGTEALETIAAV